MKKAVLISIRPKHVANILNGIKTIEIRKTKPNCNLPIDVYLYCTQGKTRAIMTDKGCVVANKLNVGGDSQFKSAYSCSGQVVAKFTLNKVEVIRILEFDKELSNKTCLSYENVASYLDNYGYGYAWHIDNLVIFDEPLLLNEHFYNVPSEATKKWFKENHVGKGVIVQSLLKAPQSWRYVLVDLEELQQ